MPVELQQRGYGYQLLQGKSYTGWPPTASKTHCWYDDRELHITLQLPPGKPAALRLHCVDGDGRGRQQRLIVQAKTIGEIEQFAGGKDIEVFLSPDETASGRIAIAIQRLAGPNAVVSTIELLTP